MPQEHLCLDVGTEGEDGDVREKKIGRQRKKLIILTKMKENIQIGADGIHLHIHRTRPFTERGEGIRN